MKDLVETLSELLKAKNIKLATAESCTGGLVSVAMTHRQGASEVFDRGFVTYSNQSKAGMLSVPIELINKHGAVSPEVAEAMAQGALENSAAQISVSITGIAGPDGGSREKPVGLVYIGYILNGHPAQHVKHLFEGERHDIQGQAVTAALTHLISVLKDK